MVSIFNNLSEGEKLLTKVTPKRKSKKLFNFAFLLFKTKAAKIQ